MPNGLLQLIEALETSNMQIFAYLNNSPYSCSPELKEKLLEEAGKTTKAITRLKTCYSNLLKEM
jgi:hypothetical protein